MAKIRQNQAQSVLEYATIIACVVLALVAMQNYIRRGVQGKLRQSADELGQQYAPRNTTGDSRLTYYSESLITTLTKSEKISGLDLDEDGKREDEVFGATTKNTLYKAITNLTGNERIYER